MIPGTAKSRYASHIIARSIKVRVDRAVRADPNRPKSDMPRVAVVQGAAGGMGREVVHKLFGDGTGCGYDVRPPSYPH